MKNLRLLLAVALLATQGSFVMASETVQDKIDAKELALNQREKELKEARAALATLKAAHAKEVAAEKAVARDEKATLEDKQKAASAVKATADALKVTEDKIKSLEPVVSLFDKIKGYTVTAGTFGLNTVTLKPVVAWLAEKAGVDMTQKIVSEVTYMHAAQTAAAAAVVATALYVYNNFIAEQQDEDDFSFEDEFYVAKPRVVAKTTTPETVTASVTVR